MSSSILTGLRVLDLSHMLSGPYCSMILADHGAEVIKIERYEGDTSRNTDPCRQDDPNQDWSGYFTSLNRGKKSITLDLKSSEGQRIFRRLARISDVVLENFRPGVMESFGLGYETLAEENPKLVYGAIRGFGDPRTGKSPYSDWPSNDIIAQAMGGLMATNSSDKGTPTAVGAGIGDIFAGTMMSFGILAALREAETTGRGRFVDIAIYDAMIALRERMVYLHDMTADAPIVDGSTHPILAPFGIFPAEDGQVVLSMVDDRFWQILTNIMQRDDLLQDARFATNAGRAAHATELNPLISEWTVLRTKAELFTLLGGHVPIGPLNTILDILNDPHVAARQVISKIEHPEPEHQAWSVAANPLRYAGETPRALPTAPRLGEHNAIIKTLAEPAQLDDTAKRDLRQAFGKFATGVTVLTTRQEDGTPRGFTANSFSSVSLDPPLLLVCLGKTAHSCDVFTQAPHFAVNILSEKQKDVSNLFASRSAEKFDQTDWTNGPHNLPFINNALASFACVQHKLVDAGDHLVLIGRVLSHQIAEGKPLGFYNGAYFDLSLEDKLADVISHDANAQIGAVLAQGNLVLLEKTKDGQMAIPKAPAHQNTLVGLSETLNRHGLSSSLNHLYAVFQNSRSGAHSIIYHGTVLGKAPAGLCFCALNDLPLSRIASEAERVMLERYQREYQHGSFGIYQGNEKQGIVHNVANTTQYTG